MIFSSVRSPLGILESRLEDESETKTKKRGK